MHSNPVIVMTNYYDGDQIIADYNNTGMLQRKYVYGPGIDEPICMVRYPGAPLFVNYYHFDGLGSVVALSAYSGVLVEKYTYDVYGKPTIRNTQDAILTTSAYGNRYLFTGREIDSETGLYYYRARYYHPSIGRFLQTDPKYYDDGLNLYKYVQNNPINFVDPFGLSSFSDCWTGCVNTMTGGMWGKICGSGLSLGALAAKVAGATTLSEILAIVPTWMAGASVGCAIGCGLFGPGLPPLPPVPWTPYPPPWVWP